jgi:AraC family transcriptional regulator
MNTDLSVGEVALSCGFSHQGHLARHFARLTGGTPSRFRRESCR